MSFIIFYPICCCFFYTVKDDNFGQFKNCERGSLATIFKSFKWPGDISIRYSYFCDGSKWSFLRQYWRLAHRNCRLWSLVEHAIFRWFMHNQLFIRIEKIALALNSRHGLFFFIVAQFNCNHTIWWSKRKSGVCFRRNSVWLQRNNSFANFACSIRKIQNRQTFGRTVLITSIE